MRLAKLPEFVMSPTLTVDIEVEDTHSYQLENGCVVHNTVSKVMNSTEAANAPANNFYLRNNQYLIEDPQYHALVQRGYPWKDISHAYPGHHIVGFPTKQQISDIMGDRVVVAAELTPEDQYSWLRWLETHWLGGNGNNGQVSYCLTKDHLVTTSSGMFRIANPLIVDAEAQDRFGKPNRVFDLVDNGLKRVGLVRLSNGVEIEGTKDHRVLTVCSNTADFVWTKIKDLVEGDVVVRRLGDNLWASNPYTLPQLVVARIDGRNGHVGDVKAPAYTSSDFGLFLGMLMSDGSMSENTLAFNCTEKSIADKFVGLVHSLFGLTSHVGKDPRAKNLYHIQANSRPLIRWLQSELGVPRYHDDNKVPDCILQSPEVVVRSFLQGYTLDSHVAGGTICITSTSKQMIKDLVALCNNLGFDPSIAYKSPTTYVAPGSSGMAKAQYVFMLRKSEANNFAATIGFLEKRKEKLASKVAVSVKDNGKQKVLPVKPFSTYYQALTTVHDKLYRRLAGAGYHTGYAILDIVDGFDHLRDSKLTFTKVESITKSEGLIATFDISVERSHEYVANSVVVHNTMKYYPENVDYAAFQKLLIEQQSTVRCCSWMQIMDMSKFAYQPEEPITEEQYNAYLSQIDKVQTEGYDEDSLQCESGVCPIEINQLVYTDGKTVTDTDLQHQEATV